MIAFALRLVLAVSLALGGLDICCWAKRAADLPRVAHAASGCCKQATPSKESRPDGGIPGTPCCSQCSKSWLAGSPAQKLSAGDTFVILPLLRAPFESSEDATSIAAIPGGEPFRPPPSTLLRLHCALTV